MSNDVLILIYLAGCLFLGGACIGMLCGHKLGCDETRQRLIEWERTKRPLP